MIYAVVNTKLAEKEGFVTILHREIGDKMEYIRQQHE